MGQGGMPRPMMQGMPFNHMPGMPGEWEDSGSMGMPLSGVSADRGQGLIVPS